MLDALVEAVHASPGIAGKADIAPVMERLAPHGAESGAIRLGDDCAAIPDGDGWLLFAMEGFLNTLVAEEPHFAGYCGVLVNISDIAAMGGRPTAVADAIWSRDQEHMTPIIEGMMEASRVYNLPVVGGHSSTASDGEQLAVAIIGRARQLLTSFDAAPGDRLLAAIDLRGHYHEPWPNWDASSGQDPQRLRQDLALLPEIAEAGLCRAAKDISMAGLIGTALMLFESSGVGATLYIDDIPMPESTDPIRWLVHTFPSYGFLLAVAPEHEEAVIERFAERDIACARIGTCDATRTVRLRNNEGERGIWDFHQTPLTGCPTVTPEQGA
ncbi:hypothetical protein CK501_08750 [Halovibrio salipaludis]|uniref:Sll0787 family AIR synthase-like protein n=1 Tax=Halovibrio salipaludis TaxID=2032626 RepID=A0A2A2F767_9GAMM|nr:MULTISPECIES: sll0787 family AIR synthase-like protein [Halomonadaceae]PAU80517.1 hypothetical protein CK501_08750 [Halovibrio salipaludis]